MNASRTLVALFSVAILGIGGTATFGGDVKPVEFVKPTPNSADEPLAKEFSLARAATFLDAGSLWWTREKKCGTCHTNFPYLMARPLLKEVSLDGHDEIRRFFEDRVAHWDDDAKAAKPKTDTEVVATACVLAFNDALTTGKLHQLTRRALDRMWTLQLKGGAWNWAKCKWPPFEHDDYFGAVFAAVGVGSAPDDYAKSEGAKNGLAKLQNYLQGTSAPNLHHKTWLMWASTKLNGLMTKEERQQTIAELLALQRPDGGWNLPSLGYWHGHDPEHANDPNGASDGYGTGFVVYALRQAGFPGDHPVIQKGVKWLRANQRESGRWFVRSLNTDNYHYVTNAGTSFAVLALKACE
jgi:squalene-hopene/tetraprenyl-beta-curcumene cyclase